MIEVLLDLDFDCCFCCNAVGVKLKCAGKGLTGGAHAVCCATIPCPHCDGDNQLYYEPCGVVIDVRPSQAAPLVLEPSLN
jgi:hypothetical protein